MTITLIVLAHPERTSFSGAWAQASQNACIAFGHRVLFSDLAAMGFDPSERAQHYDGSASDQFDPLKAQQAAAAAGALPQVVQSEIEKIKQADLIIFHFPIWWFTAPALLKGWFDRVFAHGALHDVDNRFDTGLCRGKTALFCVTTGSTADESAFNGKEGDIQMLLWPTAYTLRYLGFRVYRSEVTHGVHGFHRGSRKTEMEGRLRRVLEGQQTLIAGLSERPELAFNGDADFDDAGRLKAGATQNSWFTRHRP